MNKFVSFFLGFLIIFILGYLVFLGSIAVNKKNEQLRDPLQLSLDSSVYLYSGYNGSGKEGNYGSGVVFHNKNKSYIWTCAHVISNNITHDLSIDINTKTFKYQYTLHKIEVSQKLFNDKSEETGTVSVWANIIRFSTKDDIALLELTNTKIFRNTVVFPQESGYTVPVGRKIFHVGAMKGPIGHNSISQGIQGIHGVDYPNASLRDRISLGLDKGSSGGGVFYCDNGECVGLITAGINVGQGFMVPYRSMYKFAERLECTWALNNRVEVPDNYLNIMTDDTVVVPLIFQDMIKALPK